MNRREGQTDIWLQCKKEVLKSRRERSQAAHLVADGLVLEPQLVHNLLQLLVVEVGHPNGLGQPCILTLLQGLGGRGGEQSLGMGNRTRINAEKINKHGHVQELALSIKRKKGRKSTHKLKNCHFLHKKTKKTYHMEGKMHCLHCPKFSISFLYVNISAMVSSPQPQHPSP